MWLAVRALDGALNTRNDNVVIKRFFFKKKRFIEQRNQ